MLKLGGSQISPPVTGGLRPRSPLREGSGFHVALQQSCPCPEADLPGHQCPVPTVGTSRLHGERQRQSPLSPMEQGWRNRRSCHGDFLPSRCSGQVQEEALPPSLCGTMPAGSCRNRKPLQPPACQPNGHHHHHHRPPSQRGPPPASLQGN